MGFSRAAFDEAILYMCVENPVCNCGLGLLIKPRALLDPWPIYK